MPTDLSDSEIGGYRLASLLGRGGDSAVYVAHAIRDGQPYAFKILERDGDRDGRLLRQLVMVLDDPHVVKIYDYGSHQGRPWLVRELVIGRPLDAVLREAGPFAAADALDLAGQILAGLRAYHANGMAHGALHPGNILVTDALLVRLCDPCVDPGSAATGWWTAPELAAGGVLDQRSDQYSLGAILHHVLTGRVTAPGQARWSGHEAAGPELLAAVERMLAPDPAARFPTLAACAAGLHPTAAPAATPATPRAPAPVRPPAATASTVPARAGPAKTSRLAGSAQQQRVEAAIRRIDNALAEAERAHAGGDLAAARGHAERAQAIAVALACDLPPAATERIVAMRSRLADARQEAPRRGWRRWFGG